MWKTSWAMTWNNLQGENGQWPKGVFVLRFYCSDKTPWQKVTSENEFIVAHNFCFLSIIVEQLKQQGPETVRHNIATVKGKGK